LTAEFFGAFYLSILLIYLQADILAGFKMPATHISVHNSMYASIRCEENDSLIGENSDQSLALSL